MDFGEKICLTDSKQETEDIMVDAADGQGVLLTKRYPQILAASFIGLYPVKVSEADGLWTVSVTFLDTGESKQVKTARGHTKTWRDVKGAILFVQQVCPTAGSVTLQVGSWHLCKNESS